jgi:hypothetical protein
MPAFKGAGMNDLILQNKDIDTEGAEQHGTSKVVKLRFTRKQFESFRDACKIFEIVSADEGFPEFVKKALGADIRVPTIARQFVNPIVDAPTKIPLKIPRAQSDGPKKETYFTQPIEVTDKCELLFGHVRDDVDLRNDISTGTTCLTDVRVMVGKYFSTRDLKTDDGVVIDDFMRDLAPDAISNNQDVLQRINGKYVIPRGDKKIMAGIVNEVAFGTF